MEGVQHRGHGRGIVRSIEVVGKEWNGMEKSGCVLGTNVWETILGGEAIEMEKIGFIG